MNLMIQSFSLFLTVKTIWKLNTEHSVNLEIEIQIIALVVNILLTTQNLNIPRCCFAEEAKKFYEYLKCTCTASALLFKIFV